MSHKIYMKKAIKISTTRLVLKPRSLNDLQACLAMDRDPTVTQYIDGPWQDPEAHQQFLLDKMNYQYDYPFGYWSIFYRDQSDQFLGWVMLIAKHCGDELSVEMGWRLNRASWGCGIATEASQRMLDVTIEKYPNAQVFAAIAINNLGSIKVAEKLGMCIARNEAKEGSVEAIYRRRPDATCFR